MEQGGVYTISFTGITYDVSNEQKPNIKIQPRLINRKIHYIYTVTFNIYGLENNEDLKSNTGATVTFYNGNKLNIYEPFDFKPGQLVSSGTNTWNLELVSQRPTFKYKFIPLELPTVTTDEVTAINFDSATCGGEVLTEGTSDVTQRGVVWSLNLEPNIYDDSYTDDGIGLGTFTSSITGLAAETTYYVRAYALNSVGVAYGEQKEFITINLFGEVVIGTQTWSDRSIALNDGLGGILSPNGDSGNDADYGNLYNKDAADRIAATISGWRLPTRTEIDTLTAYLGGFSSGSQMKETGTTYWLDNDGTNTTGFNGRGSGYYQFSAYGEFKEKLRFWTSTLVATNDYWYFQLTSSAGAIGISNQDEADYISLRLIKE